MGPYCKFCNQRCFVHFPEGTPQEVLDSYKSGVTIIATCPGGQEFEKKETGWNYDSIRAIVTQKVK